MIKTHDGELLLHFMVPSVHPERVHTEQGNSKNQPWDTHVHKYVKEALSNSPDYPPYKWYSIETEWHVAQASYRRDLENFRLKPVLDALTQQGFWPDDTFQVVRRIVREAVLITEKSKEYLEVRLYGHN